MFIMRCCYLSAMFVWLIVRLGFVCYGMCLCYSHFTHVSLLLVASLVICLCASYYSRAPAAEGASAERFGCGQMGSTRIGPLQK